jgi:broad specificity phosphatase PhoE
MYGGDSRRHTMDVHLESDDDQSISQSSDDGMGQEARSAFDGEAGCNENHGQSVDAFLRSPQAQCVRHHSCSSLRWNSLRVSNPDQSTLGESGSLTREESMGSSASASTPQQAVTTAELQDNHSNIHRRKIVYFIRHGIAEHNVQQLEGSDPHGSILDASLTQNGMRQAELTGVKLAKYLKNVVPLLHPSHSDRISQERLPINTILCSPLSRCCETAVIVAHSMAGAYNQAVSEDRDRRKRNIKGAAAFQDCDDSNPQGQHLQALSSASPTPPHPPIICHELLREAYGMHLPDQRRSKFYLQSKFGGNILFDPNMTEQDLWWTPHSRETVDDVVGRIHRFFEWLMSPSNDSQIGENIILVSHGVWIECCLQTLCPEALKDGRRVYNCDVFRGELVIDHTPTIFDNSYPRCRLQNAHFVSSGTVF